MTECSECHGFGVEILLQETAPCEVCMGSSNKLVLNLDGALCARLGCHHRRDVHATRDGGTHRWACNTDGCRCMEFVIGGAETAPDYSDLPDTLTDAEP